MKDETAGIAIKEFAELKLKINFFLVDDCSKHKKAKRMTENVVAITSHNKYKDVLLNHKYLRHSMNKIQTKNHRIGIYKLTKFLYLALMIKKTMDMTDWLFVIRANKKT